MSRFHRTRRLFIFAMAGLFPLLAGAHSLTERPFAEAPLVKKVIMEAGNTMGIEPKERVHLTNTLTSFHLPITLWIDTIYACPGTNNVIVTFRALNFDTVGSLALYVWYSTDLVYSGLQYVNPELQPFLINTSDAAPGWKKVMMASFSLDTMNVPDDEILFQLKFNYLTDSSILQFDSWIPGNCEVTDVDANVITTDFISGYILNGSQAIDLNPTATQPPVSEGGSLTVTASGSGYGVVSLHWQLSTDGGNSYSDLSDNETYSGVTTTTLLISNVDYLMNAYYYRLKLTGLCPPVYSTASLLTVIPGMFNLNGIVSYLNTSNTAMSDCIVSLKSGPLVIRQVNTTSDGHFHFSDLDPGNYTLEVSTSKPHGGINSADALLIMRHFVGISVLEGLKLEAANVDLNPLVNTVDALLVMRRYVGIISSFPVPDWLFEKPAITITGETPVVQPVKALTSGDVNGDYIPDN